MTGSIGELKQWVGYKITPKMQDGEPLVKSNGKPKLNKIPKNPNTGANAKTNDPSTWSDFNTASAAMNRFGFDGVGFVFTKESGVVGIDLDDCIDEDGNLSEFALGILKLLNSYAEISPGGDGIHILVGGSIPHALKTGDVEIYDNGRFFTYTGQALPGYDLPIANRQAELDQLFEEIAGNKKSPELINPNGTSTAVSLSDQTIVEKAMAAANGSKFSALWEGDISSFESQSEADYSLCHNLAFWTGNDATAVDRLFRQSELFREKWDERHYSNGDTYGQRTVARAIANNTEIYESPSTPGNFGANGHGIEVAVASDEGLMPSLPDEAVIDPDLGKDACPWLDDHIEFSRQMSPRGYGDFHEATGLWLMSVVVARRLVLQMGSKKFFPNLYLALCANTTLYAKTTTARIAQDLLGEAHLGHLLLPNDMTPQAFINELVPSLRHDYGELSPDQKQRELQRLIFPAQRGWFYEEFGSKIQAMMRDSGFMADFRGHLRIFDDNQTRYIYKTMTRRDVVDQPYLALLANMTPADIRPYAKPRSALWQDGFWARWAFITPPVDHPPQYGRFPDTVVSIPNSLVEPIRRWHEELGIPSVTVDEVLDEDENPTGRFILNREKIQPKSCELGSGVMDAFYNYHDGLVSLAAEQAEQGNTDLTGNYGRFAEKAMRIAMLLASLSNRNRIELTHWARAQTITECWRANLHHLIDHVTASSPSQERQLQDKIIDVLRRLGTGTAAEIGRNIRNVSGPEVNEICLRLVKSGDLKVAEVTKANTNRYAVVNSRQ